jgi:hypothetical protein
MANAAFASGFTQAFGNVLLGKLQKDQEQSLQQKQTTLQALTLLMNSGQVRDPNSLTPILETLFEPSPGKKGKGKSTGQGPDRDPMTMFRAMLSGGGGSGTQVPGVDARQTASASTPGTGTPALPVSPFGTGTATPHDQTTPVSGGGHGFFLTPEEVSQRASQDEEAKARAIEAGKQAAMREAAPQTAAMVDRMIKTGTPPSVAYTLAGLKPPALLTPAKQPVQDDASPTGWSLIYYDVDGQPARKDNVAPPTGARGRTQLPTGDAGQQPASRMMQAGIDPVTGSPYPAGPERDRAVAAGKDLADELKNKNQSVTIRNETAQQALTGAPETPFLQWTAGPDRPDPDPAIKYAHDPSTGMTQASVYQSAIAYALTNQTAGFGLGSAGQVKNARIAIRNKGDAMADAAGVTTPGLQTAYKALSAALQNQVTRYTANSAASNSAIAQLELLRSSADKLPRSNAKVVNALVQYFQGNLTAATGLSQTELYVYTAARDYAKVSSGSSASIAGLTDAATKAASNILSASQAPAVMNTVIQGMQNEMQTQLIAQWNQIQATGRTADGFDTVAAFLGANTPPPGGGTTAPPALASGPVGSGRSGGAGTTTGRGGGPGGSTTPQTATTRTKTYKLKDGTIVQSLQTQQADGTWVDQHDYVYNEAGGRIR